MVCEITTGIRRNSSKVKVDLTKGFAERKAELSLGGSISIRPDKHTN